MVIRNKIACARDQRGFTLVEVTIILLVLVILSSIMLPQLGNFNRLARFVKVKEDLGAICATMKKMLDEVGVSAFWEEPGGGTIGPAGTRIGLLVGPGTAPGDNVGAAADHNLVASADPWAESAAASTTTNIQAATDSPGTSTTTLSFGVDEFDHHFQENNPFGTSAAATHRYVNTDELVSADFFLSWKGPYMDAFTADPWGARYMSNVFALHAATVSGTHSYYSSAVVCLSAGPDGFTDTKFNQPMGISPYGWVTGGDDIAVVLSSGGPF